MNNKTNNLIKIITYILLFVIVVNYGFEHEVAPNKRRLSLNTKKIEHLYENQQNCIINGEKSNTNGILSNMNISCKNIFRNNESKRKWNCGSLLFILALLSYIYKEFRCFNMLLLNVKKKSYNLYDLLKHRGPPTKYYL